MLQLAAALTLGVSGILTLWENPVVKEQLLLDGLHTRVSNLRSLFPTKASEYEDEIGLLEQKCVDQKKFIANLGSSNSSFFWEKSISILVAIVSLGCLAYASEFPSHPMSNMMALVTYAVFTFPVLLVGFLALRILSAAGKLNSVRRTLDRQYLVLVRKLA